MTAISELSRQLARDAIDDFGFWLARQPKHQAEPKPKPGRKFRQGANTPAVIEWLRAQPEPQTVDQISSATGVGKTTVREIFRRHREAFVHVGTIRNGRVGVKLWKVAD